MIRSATRLPYQFLSNSDARGHYDYCYRRALCDMCCWALVVAQGGDAAMEFGDDGRERGRVAVVNETLQHEIRMLGLVKLLDRTAPKQYAQNRSVVGRAVLVDHALESSAASAVEGSPENPTGVQIDEFAVKNFLGR